MEPEQIAEAFSRHRFEETYEFLAEDVRWDNLNGPQLAGRDAVIAACRHSAEYLATATTTFSRFRAVVGADTVVVDSEATYAGADGAARVASCDLYDFAAGRLAAITSYTVELTS
ncbi:MAG TPA: nuclear transport factor 2 family protein [Mycobacteriales bacterium]|nr:nuclear transport factor 2 family protein [Mycobacteriales bacterium]